MGLVLHLFVVTSLVAVLHSAPLDQQAESTTVGIQTLPARLSPNETPQHGTNQQTYVQRPSRDASADLQSDSTAAQSSSTTPSTESKKIRRSVDDQKAPPPPPPPVRGEDPLHRPPPPPPSAPEHHQGYPDNRPPPAPKTFEANRPEREVSQPPVKPSPLPGTIDARPEPNHGQGKAPGSRPVRDVPKQTKPAPLPGNVDTKTPQKPAPENRPQREVNDAGKGVQHRPSPIPGNIDNRPVQPSPRPANNGAGRHVRDVSSLGSASSTPAANFNARGTDGTSTTEHSGH